MPSCDEIVRGNACSRQLSRIGITFLLMKRLLAMRRLHLSLFLFACLPAQLVCLGQQPPHPSAPFVAITNVTVIDLTGAAPRPNTTVLIHGHRIESLSLTGKSELPPNLQTIDGSGKFLIPGLWDMHVHTLIKGRPAVFFPLFIANGITGVRDMGGDIPLAEVQQIKHELEDGATIGPRIFAAGPIVDGPSPFWPFSIAVSSPSDARNAVDRLVGQHADFIKVYDSIPRDSYFALAAEANRAGIPFVGHLPAAVTTIEASDHGQRSIEHLGGVSLEICSSAQQLQSQRTKAQAEEDPQKARDAFFQLNTAILTCDTSQEAKLFGVLRRNHTWQVPTLVVLRAYALIHNPSLAADERNRYMPESLRAAWASMGGPADPRNDKVQYELFQRSLQIVRDLHRAGVPLLAGTDTPNPYTYPGFSLHDELQLLVNAGLTPLEALQSATRDAAGFLGFEKDAGTIEPGKFADLVLLEANPLDDIRNTRKIAAVFVNGQPLMKTQLERLLSDVVKENSR